MTDEPISRDRLKGWIEALGCVACYQYIAATVWLSWALVFESGIGGPVGLFVSASVLGTYCFAIAWVHHG